MTGDSLSSADIYPWIALRRVSDGAVTVLGDRWLDGGRDVPDYVTEALAALLDGGQVALAVSECGGMPRVVLTDTGADRFERLCQAAMGMSAAEFTAIVSPPVDDPDPPVPR